MSIYAALESRSQKKCELCSSSEELHSYLVEPAQQRSELEASVMLCGECHKRVQDIQQDDPQHWRCLSESMWSEHAAVQVLSYRILTALAASTSWAEDLKTQLYLDDELLAWGDSLPLVPSDDDSPITVDSNGTKLSNGDTVTLIKDLDVKGANFTAKRGTTVKNITLTDDPKFIEGKVNGTTIVLVAAYLKKA